LSEDEIKRMKTEAEANAEADKFNCMFTPNNDYFGDFCRPFSG
jgi:hypothetical protein